MTRDRYELLCKRTHFMIRKAAYVAFLRRCADEASRAHTPEEIAAAEALLGATRIDGQSELELRQVA